MGSHVFPQPSVRVGTVGGSGRGGLACIVVIRGPWLPPAGGPLPASAFTC